MKKIKTYEQFTNEELNLRKAAAGVALGASLLGGMTSCKKTDIQPDIQHVKTDTKETGDIKFVFSGNSTTNEKIDGFTVGIKANRIQSDSQHPQIPHFEYQKVNNGGSISIPLNDLIDVEITCVPISSNDDNVTQTSTKMDVILKDNLYQTINSDKNGNLSYRYIHKK